MTEKRKNVPYRRFKEFENADAWEQRKLGDIVSFFSGLTYTPKDVVSKPGTFVLRSSNVKDNTIINADDVYVKSEVVNSDNVQKGDIIVVVRNGSRNLIGKHAEVKKEMAKTVIGAFMTGVRYDTPNFVNALFDTKMFNREISKNLGATINQITTGNFKNMLFKFPTDKNEQVKIGEFFSQLDHLITLHQRKYDKLKKLKSAYLTEMFTAEGERKPKRRFSGFTDDWEQRKVKDFATFAKGKGYSKNDLRKKGTPIILYGSLYTNYQTSIFGVSTFVKEKSNSVFSNGNEVIVPGSGETAEDIARASVIKKPGIIIGGDLNIIYSSSKIDPEFLAILLSNGAPQKELARKAQGKSIVHIHNLDIEKVKILFPKIEEQRKICYLLQRIDHLITLHQQQLEKLKNLKQAYLNEMFV
ncbi:restriction endonuclease subunit S [Ligilactobacillus pobuzihii]|uniref:Type ic specificity subunit n=1 Tax=Ligilactobacillus pobuzihii TaxID=449659 RepID=A0A0R2L4J5_9LACO|nr:restriction endonuclease subunit S [Ligilactobacillus pobuzihii]KRK09614.1 type ic specificity subunit [Ligilactobacillus pobuzihii E100301 = KCTC 13174]KRN96530.1 type ic specificity subunit [Ligilactobacillus pobuzihii]GEN48813.1 HsdS specificity protein of type I restriction-modification system [Ligilactobacillus pobuzihii]